MNDASNDDPNGYIGQLVAHRAQFDGIMIPAWNLAHNNPPLAAAPAALVFPGADPRGCPIWMEQEDYDEFICPPALDALITAAVNAAPAGPVPYPDPPVNYDSILPLQVEFDALLWQIFLAGGHSGYPSQGTFTQCLDFTFKNLPPDGQAYCFHLSDVYQLLPQDVTFLNIANAHADMIIRTAREQSVKFTWGLRHGVPENIAYAGVPCWREVRDPKLVSVDMKETLNNASLAAIRDSQSYMFQDPRTPYPENREGVDLAADILAERQRLLDSADPNVLDPRIRARTRYTHPPRSREDEEAFQDFLRRRRSGSS